MEDMLRVGVITSTHGIRGEVLVFPKRVYYSSGFYYSWPMRYGRGTKV